MTKRMGKKSFIALADAIREHNHGGHNFQFEGYHITALADFCQSQNPRFDREMWLAYIAGECGPNGGKRP